MFGRSAESDPQAILALEEERVVGFATVGPSRKEDPSGWGELYALYVDPDEWRRGIGTALLDAANRRLTDGGFRRACLWVLSNNVRARRFYERQGWVPTDTVATREFTGVSVEEVLYVRALDGGSFNVPG